VFCRRETRPDIFSLKTFFLLCDERSANQDGFVSVAKPILFAAGGGWRIIRFERISRLRPSGRLERFRPIGRLERIIWFERIRRLCRIVQISGSSSCNGWTSCDGFTGYGKRWRITPSLIYMYHSPLTDHPVVDGSSGCWRIIRLLTDHPVVDGSSGCGRIIRLWTDHPVVDGSSTFKCSSWIWSLINLFLDVSSGSSL
jgi:hypothetical protein